MANEVELDDVELWDTLSIDTSEPEPQACTICDCSENDACIGGCVWAPGYSDLCSICADALVVLVPTLQSMEGKREGIDEACEWFRVTLANWLKRTHCPSPERLIRAAYDLMGPLNERAAEAIVHQPPPEPPRPILYNAYGGRLL